MTRTNVVHDRRCRPTQTAPHFQVVIAYDMAKGVTLRCTTCGVEEMPRLGLQLPSRQRRRVKRRRR